MQDVSVLPLWHCLERRGGPDLYLTEYFRVHRDSHPDKTILQSILAMGRQKPVVAQMIGNDPEHLVRTARLIEEATEEEGFPLHGIDVNLGCPAPKVCGKQAGGALLKNHDLIRRIVEELRPVVSKNLTIKTRIGFASPDEFDALLDLFSPLPIDGIAIHGRTVKERYQSPVHTEPIAHAVKCLPYPVTANGNIVSVATAKAMHEQTGAAGLMIGRGAIRNPWLFQQTRDSLSGKPIKRPTLADLGSYIEELREEIAQLGEFENDTQLVHRMKKFTNYITSGIHEGALNDELRRSQSLDQFDQICREHLNDSSLFDQEPHDDGTLFCGFGELIPSGPS